MRPGLRRSDVDVSPPNVSTVMCDASEPFYFLAETLFRQQVSRCLREASKSSYSPLRRAERAAELSKADLPQRWHPENRAMALAGNPPAAGLLKGPSARRTCCRPCVMPSAPVRLPGDLRFTAPLPAGKFSMEGTTSCPAPASPSGTKCTRGSHCKHMEEGHCDLEVKLVHVPLQSPKWMPIGTGDLMKVKRPWI
ncbi:uncharacterized protein LOC121835634 [Ixodes scapularis]|uniref:uncharacterized protein LOC121835634 n=1 Tax=Ixodes scapularis TaxID=6945 RepID=UPI001C38CBFB|nr:uncharacterized protein LOC121835634 [Ixodes scapularis]